MAVTLAQLRTRIRTEINKPSTSYESFIDDAIRSAILFYGNCRFWFLEETNVISLTSTNTFAALPDDFGLPVSLRVSVNGMWVTHDTGFKHVTFDELKRTATDSLAQGAPNIWAIFGSRIYVNKIADQTYTLDAAYIKKDVTLPEEDGDDSVWFDEGRDLIRLKAMEYFYRDRLHNDEKGDIYEQKAGVAYNVIQSKHNQRQITSGLLR